MAANRQMTTAQLDTFPETTLHDLERTRASAVSTGKSKSYDFHELINSFIGYVRRSLECDGIEYELEEINLYYVDGDLESASTSYNLCIEEEHLGVIRFTRSTAFHRDELITIENMLTGLIEPLRHSLSYYQGSAHFSKNCDRYYERIEMEVERCRRNGRDFSIIKLVPASPDYLKTGDAGEFDDTAVIELIDRIDRLSRRNDMVFRIAEDEYLILCPYTDARTSSFVAERIADQIDTSPITVDGSSRIISLCGGIATFDQQDTAVSLINRCDRALLKAQIQGAGSVIGWLEDKDSEEA